MLHRIGSSTRPCPILRQVAPAIGFSVARGSAGLIAGHQYHGMFVMLPLVPAWLLLAQALTVDTSIADEGDQDPLAPARSGMVQCYEPDAASHSCQSMAAYRRGRDGAWTNVATVMADPNMALTLEIETPVTVRDGAVCGTLRREQVLGAKLRLLDRPIPADHALSVLVQIADAMGGVLDREVCTRYVQATGGMVARARISGISQAIPEQRVIWVRTDAGYRVQHRNGG
jgi:hypothetical protein